MEPKTAKARATHLRILREAAQLFSVRGYFHTTVDDVMARAGLTKGGFYAHFASKDALVRAVIDHATGLWMSKVAVHVSRYGDPREQLRQVLEGYRLYAIERTFEGGCLFVNLAIELDDQDEELRALVEERFAQFRAMVATIVELGKAQSLFRPDTPSEELAGVVVAHLTGTMMQAKVSRDFGLFDRGNAIIVRLLASYETSARKGHS